MVKHLLANSTNWTTGANVRANLVHYQARDLSDLDNLITAGYIVCCRKMAPIISLERAVGRALVMRARFTLHAYDYQPGIIMG